MLQPTDHFYFSAARLAWLTTKASCDQVALQRRELERDIDYATHWLEPAQDKPKIEKLRRELDLLTRVIVARFPEHINRENSLAAKRYVEYFTNYPSAKPEPLFLPYADMMQVSV